MSIEYGNWIYFKMIIFKRNKGLSKPHKYKSRGRGKKPNWRRNTRLLIKNPPHQGGFQLFDSTYVGQYFSNLDYLGQKTEN